jgi:CRP/FNR family transcriptional regulator
MPAVSSTLIPTLRRLPLFADLSEGQLALIADGFTTQSHDAGVIIFSEGDPCRELLIVKEGWVKLFKTAANGRHQLLSIERSGNSLTEVAVFDDGAYPSTAKAGSATVLLRLEAHQFRKVCLEYPEIALKVIKVLSHRLRRMGALVESLSFSTVRGRLITYLLDMAQTHGQKTAQGVEFALSENNEELAGRFGTVRELVSRNLGRLHNDGLILLRKRAVAIPDLERLRQEISVAG